jgi:[acyl-carrier-protein] S-malonyltransferase
VEIGPGKVLCGLVRQTAPQSRCLNVEDKASLDATLAALSEESQPSERAAGGD